MEGDKYKRISEILRQSKPVLKDPGEIENNVMRMIRQRSERKSKLNELPEIIFGWAFVGWLRRSLVISSVLLVLIFVYQQGIILRKINRIEQQAINSTSGFQPRNVGFYSESSVTRIAGLKFIGSRNKLSEREIRKLLESYNELELKYKDLLKVIEGNPALKDYFNDELPGFNKDKIKL